MATFRLKKQVAKLDEVQEAYRGAYVEKDGAFHLDPAKLEEIEFDDKAELAGALENERKERKRLAEEAKKYKDLDPEKARAALQKLNELDEKNLTDKGEFDRLLKKRSDEFDVRETELKQQLESLTGKLNQYELINPVREAALKAGVLADDIEDVLKITGHRFKLVEGKPVVLDKDGDPSSLTLEKFWGEEFKSQKPKFYGASGAGGSGAPAGGTGGGSGGAKTVKRGDFDKMDPAQQAQFVKEKGVITD
ncbi:MAG TPA: hypothetical protein VGB17_06905 [Pyrinomonadaceae bacterium]|jgi:hypothetical protein